MAFFPIFLSVVCVVRNQSRQLQNILETAVGLLTTLVSDFELIIVDNASSDDSLSVLKGLTDENGLPNLQVYALAKEIDVDTASWVGLENALGDFVAVINLMTDDIAFLPEMLEKAAAGTDVVFAHNILRPPQSIAYRVAYAVFNRLYKSFNGIYLATEAPQYRLLSRRVVNFILQHPQPAITYRHLPATGGFPRVNMEYKAKPRAKRSKKLGQNVDQGIRLLLSTTRTPMRLVTSLSLFGAAVNLLYSLYVVIIAILKTNVAPGWVSLSLQQSGMFFLLSLVLWVLGEYILQMASLSSEGPLYYVARELTSTRITRTEKLNIEEVVPRNTPQSPHTSEKSVQ